MISHHEFQIFERCYDVTDKIKNLPVYTLNKLDISNSLLRKEDKDSIVCSIRQPAGVPQVGFKWSF